MLSGGTRNGLFSGFELVTALFVYVWTVSQTS